jgi:hypothetical protein
MAPDFFAILALQRGVLKTHSAVDDSLYRGFQKFIIPDGSAAEPAEMLHIAFCQSALIRVHLR